MRYRLRTLLIAIAWVALICVSLRTPTPPWAGAIVLLTLALVLLAVLVIIYRTGAARAMAVGFLVFSVGYLAFLALVTGSLGYGLSDSTPFGATFGRFYLIVHPDIFDTVTKADGTVVSEPRQRMYDYQSFISICHYTASSLFGIVGSIAAQLLHATAKKEAGRGADN